VVVVVCGLVLLGAAAAPLLPRLRRLARAGEALRRRAQAAQELQQELADLQRRADEVQRGVAYTQQRLTALRAPSGT
jgi:Sec-independent protein translocase protein TatA